MNHIFNKCYLQISSDFNLEYIKKQDCVLFSDKYKFIDYFNTAMGCSNSLVAWKGTSLLDLVKKGTSVATFVKALSEYDSDKDLLVFGDIEDISLIILQTLKSLTNIDLKKFWRVCEKHYFPITLSEERLNFLISLLEPLEIKVSRLSPEFMYADFLFRNDLSSKQAFLNFFNFCNNHQIKKNHKLSQIFYKENLWKDDSYKNYITENFPQEVINENVEREWYSNIDVIELNKHVLKYIESINGFEVLRR
jgi:hypothetical protein